MKNPFKTLSLNLRGLTGRTKATICVLLAVLLLLGGFGIYLLARDESAVSKKTQTLFPGVERASIASVRVVPVNGEGYTVKGSYYSLPDGDGNPVQLKRFYLITSDGVSRGNLTLNAQQLAYFVVGVGKNYVHKEVTRRPEEGAEGYASALAEYESKKRELGFREGAPYYELTTEGGDVYRVRYGIKDVTGDGYYVMLEGSEVIYVTESAFIGDLLQLDGPESLLDASVFVPMQNQYGYAFVKSFALFDRNRDKTAGAVVTDEAYAVGYKIKKEDGTLLDGTFSLHGFEGESEASAHRREAFYTFFLGKSVGALDEVMQYTYPDIESVPEAERGKSYTYHIVSIDYIDYEELRFDVGYLTEDKRELSYRYSAYGFLGPDGLTAHTPDTDAVLTLLENTMKVTGTVVKLGLSDAVLNDYGLYRHRFEILYPYGEDLETDANYTLAWIYVSDETERGTRYVASIYYDLVVEVDAALFSYIDDGNEELLDDYVITAASTDLASMQIVWNYGGAPHMNDRYQLALKIEEVKNGDDSYTAVTAVTATPVGGGTPLSLDPELFAQFYARLVATRIRGSHTLSDGEVDALIGNADNCVLRIYWTLSDGVTNYVEMYPATASTVLVRIRNGKDSGVSTDFYIYRTALEDLARAYTRFAEGESFDFEDRYE